MRRTSPRRNSAARDYHEWKKVFEVTAALDGCPDLGKWPGHPCDLRVVRRKDGSCWRRRKDADQYLAVMYPPGVTPPGFDLRIKTKSHMLELIPVVQGRKRHAALIFEDQIEWVKG